MARAMKKCPVCKKLFDAKIRRKTCSTACHQELAKRISKERIATPLQEDPPDHSRIDYMPTPEEIEHMKSLIRAQKIVVARGKVVYND